MAEIVKEVLISLLVLISADLSNQLLEFTKADDAPDNLWCLVKRWRRGIKDNIQGTDPLDARADVADFDITGAGGDFHSLVNPDRHLEGIAVLDVIGHELIG